MTCTGLGDCLSCFNFLGESRGDGEDVGDILRDKRRFRLDDEPRLRRSLVVISGDMNMMVITDQNSKEGDVCMYVCTMYVEGKLTLN